jgi:hypothetical protein
VAPESEEVVLSGGSVNRVVRVGDTVRRPTGPWTEAVHRLLAHLQRVGFDGAPRVLGIDEQGREVLTYLDGVPARRPWPAALRRDEGLAQVGQMLRSYHRAVEKYRPAGESCWRSGIADIKTDEVVSHGDLGPWNSVWKDDRLVGFIDWEFAEPRRRIEDVAEVAWYFVPLRGERGWREAGWRAAPDLGTRLGVLCAAYGEYAPADLLDAVSEHQQFEQRRTIELGGAGVSPWDVFLGRGDVEQMDDEQAWLDDCRTELIDAANATTRFEFRKRR